jgi:hypothetical protein
MTSNVFQRFFACQAICILATLIFSVLIALSPFLHAHYGASTMTGLHLAGVNALAEAEPVLAMTTFSQDEEPESAAVGVEASFSRQIAIDVEDQPPSLLILTVFVMAALIQRVVAFLFMQDTQRAGRPSFLAGFPTLPHAPPTFRF